MCPSCNLTLRITLRVIFFEAYTVLKACVSGLGWRSQSLWVVQAEFTRPYIEFSFGIQKLPVVVPIPLPYFSWVREEKLYLRGSPITQTILYDLKEHTEEGNPFTDFLSHCSKSGPACLTFLFPHLPLLSPFSLYNRFLFVCMRVCVCAVHVGAHIYRGKRSFLLFLLYCFPPSVFCKLYCFHEG